MEKKRKTQIRWSFDWNVCTSSPHTLDSRKTLERDGQLNYPGTPNQNRRTRRLDRRLTEQTCGHSRNNGHLVTQHQASPLNSCLVTHLLVLWPLDIGYWNIGSVKGSQSQETKKCISHRIDVLDPAATQPWLKSAERRPGRTLLSVNWVRGSNGGRRERIRPTKNRNMLAEGQFRFGCV